MRLQVDLGFFPARRNRTPSTCGTTELGGLAGITVGPPSWRRARFQSGLLRTSLLGSRLAATDGGPTRLDVGRKKRTIQATAGSFDFMVGPTELESVTSCVSSRRSNQL